MTNPTGSADPTARLGSAVEDHLASLNPDEFDALIGRVRPPDESTKPPADKPTPRHARGSAPSPKVAKRSPTIGPPDPGSSQDEHRG